MLNKRNSDGSINMLWSQGHNINGVDVSPYMEDFRRQVEDDIWPAVSALLDRNYLTVTSCQGHTFYDSAFVTVSFPSRRVADTFISLIEDLVIYAEYDYSMTSTTSRLNTLFLKDYTEYYHVRVGVLQYSAAINFLIWPLRKYFIKYLTSKLKQLPNYELIY